MPLILRCPRSPQIHVKFKAMQSELWDAVVDVDANGNIIASQLDSVLEVVTHVADREIVCADCGTVVRQANSPIPFTPSAGAVMICDFTRGFRAPEMVKTRPVVVVSEKARNFGTCIVVPIGSKKPTNGDALTVSLQIAKYPFLEQDSWAKCEVVNSVRHGRLYRLRDPVSGKHCDTRTTMLDEADLSAVRKATAQALGLP